METKNIFEQAVRAKIRFAYKGTITVEDLWDLTPRQLKTIYDRLNSQIEVTDDAFSDVFEVPSKEDEIIKLKAAIVLHVATVKKAEKLARRNAAAQKLHDAKIDQIIARKQDAELEDKSIEDLLKMKSE